MSIKTEDITQFAFGEHVQIDVACKDRAGNALNLTGGTVTMSIAGSFAETAPLVEFTSPSLEVSVTNAVGGLVEISLSAADLSTLTEDRVYYYTIWVDDSSGVRLHQSSGQLRLGVAVQPN